MRFALKLALSHPDRWLAWLIVASLVLPPVFFGWLAYQSRTVTLVAAERQMVDTVRLLREQAEKVLETDELVLRHVERLIAGMSWDEIAQSPTLHRQLTQLDDELAQVNGIYLAAPNGLVVNSSNMLPIPPFDASDRPYFIALRDGYQGPYISRVFRGRATGVGQFVVARRRPSAGGQFDGIIVVADSPTYFEQAYQRIGDEGASIVLSRDDGEELANYPASLSAVNRPPAELLAKLPSHEPLFVNFVAAPPALADRLGAYQRIAGYPLFVGYSLPRGTVLANWRTYVILNGSLVTIGSLTVAFVGWLALRGFRNERAEAMKRQEAEAKMIEAQRMEVIGQLAAGFAHDFNNLLTVISGNIQRLNAREVADSAKIEAALSATERGDSLIRKMLTFAHRHAGDPEAVDINTALISFKPVVKAALRGDIRLEYHLAPGSMICRIDPAEFDFAILNIVSNSRHAMPGGGRLKITTCTMSIGDDSDLNLRPGEYVKVAVTDNGVGMPPEVLARAFEQFFTTRERGTGTGLGLSQVYGFAKRSAGLATIESTLGLGATVAIHLPMMEVGALGSDVLLPVSLTA